MIHLHKEADTLACYEHLWMEMGIFFYLIGCIQSTMLVDCHHCPTKPLPFWPGSFAPYLDYCFGKAGHPLLQPSSSSKPMLDIRGNPISIVGGWDSPLSAFKVNSAVLSIHELAYPDTCGGPYITNCKDCERLNYHLEAQLQGDGSSATSTTNCVDLTDEEEGGALLNALHNLRQSLGLF
jgi:hypothetical protein